MTSKVQLPRIDQRNGLTPKSLGFKPNNENTDGKSYISPFRLPADDEVFVYRETERKKKDDLKRMSQDLRIWDKRTTNMTRPLKLFKSFEMPLSEDMKLSSRSPYSIKEKTMIIEAQNIIKEMRKKREVIGRDQKEGIVELLEQKKEMFLVDMMAGIIEKERETLIKKANEKENALKKSEEMLEKDEKEFETYKIHNKLETDQAIQKYNQEVEMRKKTETEYKLKNNDLTSLRAEKTKNEELIEKYSEAKNFLLKLTPKEIIEQSQKELNDKIEEFKANWIETKLARNGEPENIRGMATKDKKPLGKKTQRQDLERTFIDKLEKGEFDDIEEFKLNQNVYFSDPEQLVEIFSRLEEGNLALIQMRQDTEQSLDTLKNILEQKKIEFEKKIGGLRENKLSLEKNKSEKLAKIKALESISKQPRLSKKYDALIPLKKKMIEIVNVFKDEIKGTTDMETLPDFDLLAMIELHLEKQLTRLNEFKPTRILELKKICEERRKAENRKMQIEKENMLAEERRARENQREKEKNKKKRGRHDMTKSTPLEKKEAVVQVAHNTEEEEDLKYFRPYLTKY